MLCDARENGTVVVPNFAFPAQCSVVEGNLFGAFGLSDTFECYQSSPSSSLFGSAQVLSPHPLRRKQTGEILIGLTHRELRF